MSVRTQKPIHIDAKENDRPVVMSPEDEDRFVLSCQETVRAAKLGISRAVFIEELKSLFSYVTNWIEGHLKERVQACYAVPCDAQIVIFVIPVSNQFDFELSGKLTELDLEIAEKFQICPCDLLQIPGNRPESLKTFVDMEIAAHLYGQDLRSQTKVES